MSYPVASTSASQPHPQYDEEEEYGDEEEDHHDFSSNYGTQRLDSERRAKSRLPSIGSGTVPRTENEVRDAYLGARYR